MILHKTAIALIAFGGVLFLTGTAAQAQPAGQAWRPWDDADWRARGQEVGGAPTPVPPMPTPAPVPAPFVPPAAPVIAEPIAPAAPPQPVAPVAAEPAPQAVAVAVATPSRTAGRIGPPPAGKSQVVFFRNSSIVGAALSFSVREGGRGLAKLGVGSYVVAILEPGVHVFDIKSEVIDTLRLELEPDETYYVQQSIGVGVLMGRPRLALSDVTSFDKYPKLHPSTKTPTDTD